MGTLLWRNCKSPVAHSCGLLNHPNSFHGRMFKLNAKCDADSLPYSVILNVTATQYTHSLNSISHPHWLVQWGRHCSHVLIPVHSPWLPGYIDVMQAILVILTMTRLFPDWAHHVHTKFHSIPWHRPICLFVFLTYVFINIKYSPWVLRQMYSCTS